MNLRWVYTAVHNYNQGHDQSWNKIIRCSLTKKNEHHYRTRRPLTHFSAVVITVDVWITNSGAFGVYFGRSYTFTCRNRHFWVSCGASCRSTLRRVESLNQVLSKLKPKQADVDHTLNMICSTTGLVFDTESFLCWFIKPVRAVNGYSLLCSCSSSTFPKTMAGTPKADANTQTQMFTTWEQRRKNKHKKKNTKWIIS